MVAITSGKVLVTGASGYIGAWVVKYLIERGYTVSVAVRNAKQGDFIANRFPEYKGKISYTLVPDIQKEDAYDEAVKNVDAIIHIASPVVWVWEDPEEIIGPAVGGAVNILKSAHKFGDKVQRVLLTSSALSISGGDAPPNTVLDESIWNTSSPANLKENGKKSSPWVVYDTSKTLAEKAAWDWVKENNPKFDFAAILPVFNFGPIIHDVPSKEKLSSTPSVFLSTFPAGDTSGSLVGDWVDVRDSALLHVLALETPAAGGERILTTNGTFAWQDLYDILIDAGYPNIPGKESKGVGKNKVNKTRFSNAKSLKLFPEFKYRGLEEAVKEMGAYFQEAGFF